MVCICLHIYERRDYLEILEVVRIKGEPIDERFGECHCACI